MSLVSVVQSHAITSDACLPGPRRGGPVDFRSHRPNEATLRLPERRKQREAPESHSEQQGSNPRDETASLPAD